MKITPTLCKAARLLLGWSQSNLASKAKISVGTISNYERGTVIISEVNLETITKTLEGEGVQFMNNDDIIGIALCKHL